MAFDGFGGTGGQLAQQLEAARSAGTGYHPMEASSSLSVSTILSLSFPWFKLPLQLSVSIVTRRVYPYLCKYR